MAITLTDVSGAGGGVQSAYPLEIGESRLGAYFNSSENEVYSPANTSGAIILFGQPVSRNGENAVRAYTSANGFGGFALVSDTFVPKTRAINGGAELAPGYPDKYAVNVLTTGTIWVLTTTNVVTGGQVALLNAGADSVVASGTASSTNIKAYFLKDASAGSLVPIQLVSLI